MSFYQKKSGANGNAFLGGFTVAEIAAQAQTVQEQLQTPASLEFLQPNRKISNIFDKKYWSLYENGKAIPPLKFSNGKTQENVVEEIVEHIKKGAKVILLHGACGTGKSAIALNIARVLGKTSVIVPIKSLQRQYEEDYTQKKYLAKHNGEKMKIALITGRENHDSIIEPGKSCADPFLPDTIKITEKNRHKLIEYYKENPLISNKTIPSLRALRRISIAPANPHWSPIIPSRVELNQLKDAKQINYLASGGEECTFYYRKPGCSYYDQYLAYKEADVIIFNSAKYLSEMSLGRKPATEIEIIDEADEFLDNLSNSFDLNLTRLAIALRSLNPAEREVEETIDKMMSVIQAEETNKRALGIDENHVYSLSETKISELLSIVLNNRELQSEISLDEMNYANLLVEAARDFKDSIKETYLTYRKEDDSLFATLATTNVARRFEKIVNANKTLVLMSGTLHSEKVLKHIFGIENFVPVQAEALHAGAIEIHKTGEEIDCRYANFQNGMFSRERYLRAFDKAVKKATRPTLIHVNAFSDLPSGEEKTEFELQDLMSREELLQIQKKDKTGEEVRKFKQKKTPVLFTTKCARGVDFPGDVCLSVVFTKYPNPNVKDTFWKILFKTHPNYYWEFYKDKAQRDFLQRIYRAVRSKDDHVSILSPDSRVLAAVRELQDDFLQ